MGKQAAADVSKQPFFLAMGIHKPHLPWAVPKRFWDRMADWEEIPLASDPLPPTNMPDIAWHLPTWAGFPYALTMHQPVPDDVAKQSRRAYYAAVSFADELVGNALQTLRDVGLEDQTVIALTADHGWQLGEHNEWC